MVIPLIRAHYLMAHAQTYKRLGGRSDRLLGKVGVDHRMLHAPNGVVPMSVLEQFVLLAITDTSLAFAWQSAPRRLADLGPIGDALERATSLHEALMLYSRLVKGESTGANFWLDQRPDAFWLCGDPFGTHELFRTYSERFNAQVHLAIIRHWTGQHWYPDELHLRTGAIPEDERFRSILRIRYGMALYGISIPHRLLSASVSTTSGGSSLDEYTDLGALDFVESFTRVLQTYLPSGAPTVTEAGRILGMSGRSLQRQLNDAGTSYSQVLAGIRRTVAVARLEQSGHSIATIAHELGYLSSARFSRAFREWVGVSPEDFRDSRCG